MTKQFAEDHAHDICRQEAFWLSARMVKAAGSARDIHHMTFDALPSDYFVCLLAPCQIGGVTADVSVTCLQSRRCNRRSAGTE